MTSVLDHLIEHDMSDECLVCRAQDVVAMALMPAAAAWEVDNGLPRFSVALHGAAELLGAMLQEGLAREAVEATLALGGHAVIHPGAAVDGLACRFERAVLLQRMQGRIDHALTQRNRFAGHDAYGLDEFVTVHVLTREQAQNQ